MNKFLSLVAFTLVCSYSIVGFTSPGCNMSGCAAAVNVDAGKTAVKCEHTGTNCVCSTLATGSGACEWSIRTSCAGSWWPTDLGGTTSGKRCCALYSSPCPKDTTVGSLEAEFGPLTIEERIEAVEATEGVEVQQNSGFENIFNANKAIGECASSTANCHFAWVNNTLVGPTYGRANSYAAKLDVCLESTDTSNLVNHADCEAGCNNTENNHCTADTINDDGGSLENNGRCLDRCDCYFATGGTCENF